MLTHQDLIHATAHDLVMRDGVEDRVVRGLLRYFNPDRPEYVTRVTEWQQFLAAGDGQLSDPGLFLQAGAIRRFGPKFILGDDPYPIRAVHQTAMLFWKEEVQTVPDWSSFADRITHSGRVDLPRDCRVKLAAILAGWLGKAPEWSELVPVLGTGATADRCDAETRWYIPSRPIDIPDDFYRFNAHDPRSFRPAIPLSRAAAVPKNRKSCRFVASEPVGALAGQLALKRFIDHRCADLFRTKVPLGDASKHIRLMLSSPDYVTLDLSDASDLLSVQAMYEVLPRDWFELLMSCRSQGVVLPNGDVIPAATFATMGNGFCFRILSLLTAAVCEAHRLRYSVYGDDLIVHRTVAPSVCAWLSWLGLRVNALKCCYGRYRETCGAEVLDSYDIRPFKPKRILSYRGQPADVEQAYNALVLQLPTVAQYLLSGVGSCPTRSNHRLQYVERRIPARVPRQRCTSIDGWPGMTRWAILNAHLAAPSPYYDAEVRKYTRTSVGFKWVRDSDKLSDLNRAIAAKSADLDDHLIPD